MKNPYKTTRAASIIALLLTFAAPGSPRAATINVPDAKATLQAAIDAAAPGDLVLAAPGTYRENINFKGKGIRVLSSGGPAVTIIDGNRAGSVVTFNSGETRASELGGFTIQNGYNGYGGGGISVLNSSPTISHNRIIDNPYGGGIYVSFGSPLVSANLISRNHSDGGISIYGAGTAEILDNEITENVSGWGGGIFLFAADAPTIKGNLIKRNTGSQGGGIATVNNCRALITQNLIAENKATSTYEGGGGVQISIPSGFQGPTLLNNSIVGNEGPLGSGIVAKGFLSHTRIDNNVVVAAAGQAAIYCDGSYDPTPPQLSHNAVYSPSGDSLGGTCAGMVGVNGNITTDPRLIDATAGGYYPQAGSPVIDAGDSAAASLPEKDLDGSPRLIDGNGDGSARVDMGAYEFDPSRPTALIAGAPSGSTAAASARLSIGGAGIISYRYALDDAPFNGADRPVALPIDLANLANGRHIVRVFGKRADAHAQLPSAATIATWIVDPAPPTTSASVDSSSSLGSFSVTLACDDGNAGSGCAQTLYCLGTGCTPNIPYPGGEIGIAASTELRFQSTDRTGNRDTLQTRYYTVVFPDTAPPVVTGFSIPGRFGSLTIAATLYAADNVRVTGYCLTESPEPSGCTWTSTAPATYTLGSRAPHTLYAFARDAAGNVSAPASASTASESNFIPVAGRVDMVYDPARGLLYITSGDSVLRYHLASASFLSPYRLGGKLAGIDLSPDGNRLAVADRELTGIRLVDLGSGAVTDVPFTPVTSEGGSFSLAFGADGAVLASARFNGSGGSVPLRRYDPASGAITTIANVQQDAVLSGSADGNCIAYSGSPVGVYDVASQTNAHFASGYWSGSELSANRDCTQFALPTYLGTAIFDDFMVQAGQIGNYPSAPIAAAYHPGADIVYLAWNGTSEVRAFETRTFSQLASYDFGDTYPAYPDSALVQGRLRVSRDGTLLFGTVKDGIRFQWLSSRPVAYNHSAVTNESAPVTINLTGKSYDGSQLSYQVLAVPSSGTVTGNAPQLTYTPASGFVGDVRITFTVSDATDTSIPADVTISVRHDATPPVIDRFLLPPTYSSLLVPVVFEASDDIGVSGYCLSESADGSGCVWKTPPPPTHAFSASGARTLYAFARDAAGNIATTATADTVITLADSTAPATPGLSIPATGSSLNVPVTLTSGETSWGTNYCLSEGTDPGSCAWATSPPSSYTFGDYGPHILQAWVRDPAGNVSAPASATVLLTGHRNFIPASGRFDMVHDSRRDLVYITSGNSVLSYHLATGTFLPPYKFTGLLQGIDISPDGNTLAIADARLTGIHLVDLPTNTVLPDIAFVPALHEGGSFSLAFGADGALLVTTDYNGSGWTPLRRVDPASGTVTVISKPSPLTSKVRNKSRVSASAGGACIGYAESDSSDGPLGIYDVASRQITRLLELGTGTRNSNTGIGSNRDCTQFSVISDGGTFFFDAALNRLTKLGEFGAAQPMGVAYHPAADTVYLSWAGSDEIRAYDSATFAQTATYHIDSSLANRINGGENEGLLRISDDGALLLVTVKDGIRYQRLSGGPVADDQRIASRRDTPVTVYLTGSNFTPSSASYRLLTQPVHGTLSGTAPRLTYTPAASFAGEDSFTFAIDDGQSQSDVATIGITVQSDSTPPVIDTFTIPYYQSSATVSGYRLSASDSSGVTGYCLSESASSSGCSWSETVPASYTFKGLQPPQGMAVTRDLYAFVRDAALNISNAARSQVNIAIPDSTQPTIAGFRIPSSQIGLDIPVALLAADNVTVYSYCLTEDNGPSDCNWKGTSPASYRFTGGGEHVLSAYARDAAGNISGVAGAAVTILLPPAITSGTSTVFEAGSPNTFTVTTSGYPIPVLTASGTLPSGITFTDLGDGMATLAGTPTDASVGTHRVIITAENGVLEPAQQDFTLTVITLPPRLIVSTLPDEATSASTVLNVSGAVTSPYGIGSLTVNGVPAALTPEGTFSTMVHLVRGPNSITVVATDRRGVSTTERRTIFMDGAAPPFTISSPEDGAVSSGQFLEISGTLADPTIQVLYAGNSRELQWASKTGTNFSGTVQLQPGMNTLEVATFDAARGSVSVMKRTVFYNPAFSIAVNDPVEDIKTGASGYLLRGTISKSATPVTVSVAVDGQSYAPAVIDGSFEQQLTFGEEKVYAVTVTATDQDNHRVSVQRNFHRIWYGDITNESNGSGEIDVIDAYLTLMLVDGRRQATARDRLRVDVAPFGADGKPKGDGVLDIADVIMTLRKLIGVSTW